MNFRSFNYFFKEALINLTKNKLMTIAAISTVIVSLIIFGAYLLVLNNLKNFADSISEKIEITAYFKEGLTKEDLVLIKTKISQFYGIKDIKLVTKDIALQKMQNSLGEKVDLKELLGENPLPNSLEIKVINPKIIPKVIKQLKKIYAISEVVYSQQIVKKIISLSKVVEIIGFIAVIILGLAATILITNAIRLTIFARRQEIKIMQLVGATDWFIKWPFLLEGIFQGIIGALLASAFLFFGYDYLSLQIKKILPFMPVISISFIMFKTFLTLMISGIILGIAGSLFGVGKILVEN